MAGKFALIIGNSQYDDATLKGLQAPDADARALAEVLGDAAIGGFEVRTLINESSFKIIEEIESFFENRKSDDLLLFYFSGHGVKDQDAQLYFAVANTKVNRLLATAIRAQDVNNLMRRCPSKQQVLLLDCCYSGAFAKGMIAKKVDSSIGTRERFDGRGRVILTASDSMQYAFEGDKIKGRNVQSVFTNVLVEGLGTGDADLDNDGLISFDELADYVCDRVADHTPDQTPKRWELDARGKILIAKSKRYIERLDRRNAEDERLAQEKAKSVAISETPSNPIIKFVRDVWQTPIRLMSAVTLGFTLLSLICFGSYIGVIEPSLRPTLNATAPVGQARVENISGTVFFQEAGQPSRQLVQGQTIKAGYGSYIQAENGKAQFSFADGASVLVGPNTEVELAQLSNLTLNLKETVLTLKRGVIVVNITVRQGASFKIRTNLDVEVFVVGSIMGARYDPLTQLFDADCFEGKCRLLNQSLLGGQHSRTDSGRNPGSPDPVNYDGYIGLDLFEIGVRPTATFVPTATGTTIPTSTRPPTATPRPAIATPNVDFAATSRAQQQTAQAIQTQVCAQSLAAGTPCP